MPPKHSNRAASNCSIATTRVRQIDRLPNSGEKLGTRRGLALGEPPKCSMAKIFAEIGAHAVELGLGDFLEEFDGKSLRVATMCSGTDSPVLALQLLQGVLSARGYTLDFRHLFSAEIVSFKQAFLQRNFAPPVIFCDIEEIDGPEKKIRTAFGGLETVPGRVHLLVAGFACVDFSNLNTFRKDLLGESKNVEAKKDNQGDAESKDETNAVLEPFSSNLNRKTRNELKKKGLWKPGESGATLFSILDYAEDFRPSLVLLENVVNAPWSEIETLFQGIGYVARAVKVDSKNFFMPCTRERGYLLAINVSRAKVKDEDGIYVKVDATSTKTEAEGMLERWTYTFGRFQVRASSPVDSFLLSHTDPELRKALDAARPARWAGESAWDKSQERHAKVRRQGSLGQGMPITKWDTAEPRGPLHAMQRFFQTQPPRVNDMLDIIALHHLEKRIDISYKSFISDVSQNVDRKLGFANRGISSCTTPSGILYSTLAGRPLSGFEYLTLQGIPKEAITLAGETNANLQDLAGNAMTSTVVLCAMLSALIEARRAIPAQYRSNSLPNGPWASLESDYSHLQQVLPEELAKHDLQRQSFEKLKSLALASSRWCYCEDHDGNAGNTCFRCLGCGTTACEKCRGNPSHYFDQVPDVRRDFLSFELMLRGTLPSTIAIRLKYELFKQKMNQRPYPLQDYLKAALEDNIVNLASMQRNKWWTITYRSRGFIVELVFEPDFVRWEVYINPTSSRSLDDPLRFLIEAPVARLCLERGLFEGKWETRIPLRHEIPIKVAFLGPHVPSSRSRAGLEEYLEETIPITLKLSCLDADRPCGLNTQIGDIIGTWNHLPECGTALSCLYTKKATDGTRVYLFIDPRPLDDHSQDLFVISRECRRMDIGERRDTEITLNRPFLDTLLPSSNSEVSTDPSSPLKKKNADQSRQGRETGNDFIANFRGVWLPCSEDEVRLEPVQPNMSLLVLPGENAEQYLNLSLQQEDCYRGYLTVAQCDMPWHGPLPLGCTMERPFTLTDTRTKSIFAMCPALVMQLAKCVQLPTTETNVIPLRLTCTASCAPRKPELKWIAHARPRVKTKTLLPRESALECVEYERSMKKRPAGISVHFSVSGELNLNANIKIDINLQSLIHQAVSKSHSLAQSSNLRVTYFINTSFKDLTSSYLRHCFTTNGCGRDDRHVEFEFTQSEEPQPGCTLRLQGNQPKSLGWMLDIEHNRDGKARIQQRQTAESQAPGLNWLLRATAYSDHIVPGGLVADEVGYGKTALSIALVQHELDRACAFSESREENPSLSENLTKQANVLKGIAVKATLIVVPRTLVRQWSEEIKRFWQTCEILEIADSRAAKKITVRQFKKADIVVCASNFIGSSGYLERCAEFAGLPTWATNGLPPPRPLASWLQKAHDNARDTLNKLDSNVTNFEEFARSLETRRATPQSDKAENSLRKSKRRRGAERKVDLNSGQEYKSQEDYDADKDERMELNPDPVIYETPQNIDARFGDLPVVREELSDDKDAKEKDEHETGYTDLVDLSATGIRRGEDNGSDISNPSVHEFDSDSDLDLEKKVDLQEKPRNEDSTVPQEATSIDKAIERLVEADEMYQPIEGFKKCKSIDDIRNPPLQLFNFYRKIVDEYHNLDNREMLVLKDIQSRYVWLISGTPRLDTVEQIDAVAEFIGCPLLAVDGIERSGGSRENLTSLERFEMALSCESNQRKLLAIKDAQDFLDRFCRANRSPVGDMPLVEHANIAVLDRAHEAYYHKIEAKMCGLVPYLTSPFRILEIENDFIDRLHNLNHFMRLESPIVQALCMAACELGRDPKKLERACIQQVQEVKIAVAKEVHFAQSQEGPAAKRYELRLQNLQDSLKQGKLCKDPDLHEYMVEIFGDQGQMDNMLAAGEGSEDDSTNKNAKKRANDKISNYLNYAHIIVRHARYLHNLTGVPEDKFQCDICSLEQDEEQNTRVVRGADVVLAECGHKLCSSHVQNRQQQHDDHQRTTCPVPRCGGAMDKAQIVDFCRSAVQGSHEPEGPHGAKAASIVNMIKKILSDGDEGESIDPTLRERMADRDGYTGPKILVFSQFDLVSRKISRALDEVGIANSLCISSPPRSKIRDAYNEDLIHAFKEGERPPRMPPTLARYSVEGGDEDARVKSRGKVEKKEKEREEKAKEADKEDKADKGRKKPAQKTGKKPNPKPKPQKPPPPPPLPCAKVLILDLGSDAASGHNLQRANHVVFATPLVPTRRLNADAQYAQAVGRCRRRGQPRARVHAYYCAGLRTVEVDLFEQRLGKVLVRMPPAAATGTTQGGGETDGDRGVTTQGGGETDGAKGLSPLSPSPTPAPPSSSQIQPWSWRFVKKAEADALPGGRRETWGSARAAEEMAKMAETAEQRQDRGQEREKDDDGDVIMID